MQPSRRTRPRLRAATSAPTNTGSCCELVNNGGSCNVLFFLLFFLIMTGRHFLIRRQEGATVKAVLYRRLAAAGCTAAAAAATRALRRRPSGGLEPEFGPFVCDVLHKIPQQSGFVGCFSFLCAATFTRVESSSAVRLFTQRQKLSPPLKKICSLAGLPGQTAQMLPTVVRPLLRFFSLHPTQN